jgi:hypothetical protein
MSNCTSVSLPEFEANKTTVPNIYTIMPPVFHGVTNESLQDAVSSSLSSMSISRHVADVKTLIVLPPQELPAESLFREARGKVTAVVYSEASVSQVRGHTYSGALYFYKGEPDYRLVEAIKRTLVTEDGNLYMVELHDAVVSA